jgi:RNA polymerase sigma-70 factor (ECF subfamily)
MSGGHRHGGPDCRALLARLSEYIDGELEAGVCDEIDAHMGGCDPCQRFVEALRRTVRLVESEPAAPLPAEAREEIRRALDSLRRNR